MQELFTYVLHTHCVITEKHINFPYSFYRGQDIAGSTIGLAYVGRRKDVLVCGAL